jgi:predicted glycoside hydrolase/deacetylase ChbG (UPF0249 family)
LPRLIVTADDYGYSRRYNEGILRAAAAGAIDATSAMVLRPACDPTPIAGSGVEVGLHVERPVGIDDEAANAEPRRQLALFEDIFERPPAYLDGHHHCHATEPMAAEVEAIALELGVRVRSAVAEHRARLRELGVETSERLIGRYEESGPPLPVEVEEVAAGAAPPSGLTEWMMHPGLSDPGAGSSFDRGREDDLAVALRFAARPSLRRWRDGRR